MLKRILREEILGFITLLITIAIRVVYIQFFVEDVVVNNYYQSTSSQIEQLRQFGLSEVYTGMLSVVMLFCGNSADVVMYTNVLLQILTVVFVYLAIRVFTNSNVASAFSMMVSLVLIFAGNLREGSGMYVFILVVAAVVCLMCLMAKLVSNSKNTKSNEFRESAPIYEGRKRYSASHSELGEMREITLDSLEEREQNAIQYIENPLPVPKRREHKAMDYALDIGDDSDYDLIDLEGLDYYDFE